MKRTLSAAVLVFGVTALFFSPAEAGRLSADCAYELGPKSSGLEMIACLQGIAFQLQKSEQTVKVLRRELALVNANTAAGVPSGAVAAFDLVKGCPSGWSEFRPAAGRFILGVGGGNEDKNGDFLTRRGISETGGEEQVTLTEAEMPEHRHEIWLSDSDGDGRGIDAANDNSRAGTANPYRISKVGKASPAPVNNMPPYIALYFCKKD